MATYEELSKFLDEYTTQQPPFGAEGAAQQLSPYEQMVRERYGTPENAQAQQDKPGLIGAFLRGAASNALGTIGGQAEAFAS